MPIGFDSGGGGGGGSIGAGVGNRPPDLDALEQTWDRVVDTAQNILEPVWEWIGKVVSVARWVLETVAQVYPVQWYVWQTAADERTCPECGAIAGETWPEDRPHVAPPLHVNCRCQIQPAFTEWRTRYVQEWRLRWFQEITWLWKVTGWE